MTILFKGNADNERAITLQLSLNGVRAHKTGKNEVWPFICFVLNLPPSHRF